MSKRLILPILSCFIISSCKQTPLVDKFLGAGESESAVITGVSPNPMVTGSEITVSGQNFGTSTGAITIGTTKIIPTQWSDTVVKFVIPGNVSGSLSIITPYGVATYSNMKISNGILITRAGDWINSGISVTLNQKYSIKATGSCVVGGFLGTRNGNPDGNDTGGTSSGASFPWEPVGKLFGKLSGVTFAVGSSFSGNASSSGEISFLVNNASPGLSCENVSYTVTITIDPS